MTIFNANIVTSYYNKAMKQEGMKFNLLLIAKTWGEIKVNEWNDNNSHELSIKCYENKV